MSPVALGSLRCLADALDRRLVVRHVRYCSQNSPWFGFLSKRRDRRNTQSGYRQTVPGPLSPEPVKKRRSGLPAGTPRPQARLFRSMQGPRACEDHKRSPPRQQDWSQLPARKTLGTDPPGDCPPKRSRRSPDNRVPGRPGLRLGWLRLCDPRGDAVRFRTAAVLG